MIKRRFLRRLSLLLCLWALLPLWVTESVVSAGTGDASATATSTSATNGSHVVTPGPVDGQIAAITAYLLTNTHYLKKPFDASVSSQFFDRYLETLDPQHIHFTQGDLAEFAHYRTNLNHLTNPGHRAADTTPACVIFNRFMERLEQRTAYAQDLLKNEKFTFDSDERITINRKDLPYPANLDEAKRLWKERLRFEYLQELLGKTGAKKKNSTAATKSKSLANETSPLVEAPVQPRSLEAGTSPTASTNQLAATSPKKTVEEEIIETLNHRYHRNLRFFTDWNNEDVLQYYLTALTHVYDPHSDYLGRAQLEQFAISMNLSLCGIGAELLSEDGYCHIRRVMPGGPAEKSKQLKENDCIVAVAQSNQPPVDIVDMSLNKAVQLIRGPKGTQVRLTIVPAGEGASERKVLSLIRDEIPLEEFAAKAKIIDMPDSHGGTVRVGVIDLPSFYATFPDVTSSKDKPEPKSTTADVAALLDKLNQEHVAGVILDLRRNGGGSLEEAIKLTGLFVRTNPVVQVKDYLGTVQQADDTDPEVKYDGPLVVLTSRFSASASEILAGALQDYGRALIVGDVSTHGKGTVQSVNNLRQFIPIRDHSLTNEPGALKLTIKEFFRPSGTSTQLKGVVPDIVLPSVANESKDIGESALENPLPPDTLPSSSYDRFNLVDPYLPELRKRSTERVAADKEFAYLREDIELFKKHQADKTISLNEKQRLKEQEDIEARQKARDKERQSRPEPSEKVYELTLKQAALPGLPPPVTRTNVAQAKLSARSGSAASGGSTNAVASASASSSDTGLDDADAEKTTAPDETLLEAEHILIDYLSVLPKGNLVTTIH
jgi:carboxyl-terminal processing protease